MEIQPIAEYPDLTKFDRLRTVYIPMSDEIDVHDANLHQAHPASRRLGSSVTAGPVVCAVLGGHPAAAITH